ncbi:hypothetical protein C7974DRAFT_405253 [Boeremia exigua]|uniref:uncharacterized protein n=1 Tax=Boeremia exigua TaxID=749465 RepID=UPI001E8CC058|nr:uncharacterized protein C7974DRAFT_405253 [Boeremia exigua]KAH6613155.1 hypothetical protein C7974DRAFT_405253 [Boeremia exigua]
MFKTSLFLPLLAVSVICTDSIPLLFKRQTTTLSCQESGGKLCGSDNACIPLTTTCCPAPGGSAGCRPGDYCAGVGTGGLPVCCPIGKVCTGLGGIQTVGGGTVTSVSTIVDKFPTTIVDVSSTTTEDVVVTLASTSVLTSTLTGADDDTLTSTSATTLTSISTLTSVSTNILTSVSSSPILPSSHTSTTGFNATAGTRTATTSLPEFTGGADSRTQEVSSWLLAIALPLFAL